MKKLWSFLGSNFDTLIAIIISIVAAIYGIFGDNQLPLLAGIAATLSILAFGLIRDRLNREALKKQVDELRMALPNQPSAMAFFRPIPELGSYFKSAHQIDLCGVTLASTINRNFPLLRERLEAGAKLRFLLIDPNSHAAEMSAQRSENPIDIEYYQRRVESALIDLAYLYKSYKDIKQSHKNSSKPGDMSVRLMPYAPSFGMVNLDSSKKQGIVFVEIYSHISGYISQPTFNLTPENDQKWYSYFVEQYKQMWDAAKPWDPELYLQKIPFEK